MFREWLFASGLMAVCMVIQTGTMVTFAQWMIRKRDWIQVRQNWMLDTLVLLSAFALVVVLQVIAASIWAIFYYARGLFPDLETSMYFSLVSYASIGYGDVVLPQRWRLVGALEGMSGVLLCGLATAFIFAVLNTLFKIRLHNRTQRPE